MLHDILLAGIVHAHARFAALRTSQILVSSESDKESWTWEGAIVNHVVIERDDTETVDMEAGGVDWKQQSSVCKEHAYRCLQILEFTKSYPC
jgi:hypothetical protein